MLDVPLGGFLDPAFAPFVAILSRVFELVDQHR